jgi:hypothetical protein
MRIRLLAIFLVLLVLSAPALTQNKNCGETSGFVIDQEKPSVYITFERFGKANDWKEARLGEWSDKSAIKKGNDVWLRLNNNSCWDITFNTDSLYINKAVVDGKPKMIFGVLEDGAIANIQYKIEEQDRKQVTYGAHGGNVSSLPAGRSVLFGVLREHLENDRSIYVPFQYGWEKKKFSSNLEPMHRSFFWGYRLEEVSSN